MNNTRHERGGKRKPAAVQETHDRSTMALVVESGIYYKCIEAIEDNGFETKVIDKSLTRGRQLRRGQPGNQVTYLKRETSKTHKIGRVDQDL